MTTKQPRVLPTTEEDWDADTSAMMAGIAAFNGGRVLNVLSTVARHPKLLKRWMPFGNHVMGGSTLPARERELIILRTGYNARSGYEWAQHVAIARAVGLTDGEIERVAAGPTEAGWSAGDATLLNAVDELASHQCIATPTWTALRERWSEQQCIDIVFTVGQYHMISMALNTFKVEIDEGVERFPEPEFTMGRFAGENLE